MPINLGRQAFQARRKQVTIVAFFRGREMVFSSMGSVFKAASLVRFSLLATGLSIALFTSGCCGPMACGVGCNTGGCDDCDGTAGRPIPMGPLDGLRNFRQSLVCGGGGCGETYFGEWISTPPDDCDPCCGTQFVGGATPRRPFCWQPGSLLGSLNFYGQRFCDGATSSAPCECGGGCEIGGEYLEGDEYSGEVMSSGVSGCATCAARQSGSSQFARSSGPAMSQRTNMARSAAPVGATRTATRTDARVERIRR